MIWIDRHIKQGQNVYMNMNAISKAPLMTILMLGFRQRCPRCGRGRLYRSCLKPVDACQSCAGQLGHMRADNIPAYFTILLVGHVVVPLMIMTEQLYHPEEWVHLVMWVPMLLI